MDVGHFARALLRHRLTNHLVELAVIHARQPHEGSGRKRSLRCYGMHFQRTVSRGVHGTSKLLGGASGASNIACGAHHYAWYGRSRLKVLVCGNGHKAAGTMNVLLGQLVQAADKGARLVVARGVMSVQRALLKGTHQVAIRIVAAALVGVGDVLVGRADEPLRLVGRCNTR